MTIERHISGTGSNVGYRHFSTPFSNSSLATFQYSASNNVGGVLTYGFTGSNIPSAGGYVSTYSYSEASAASNSNFGMGWVAATNSSNPIGFDNAQTFYSGGPNYTSYSISCTGTPNVGTKTISNLSYGGSAATAGWHLIGNPYASTIDWDMVTKVGTDAIAYVFEQSNGGYTASNLLPDNHVVSSYQGFFIHVTSATNSIQFDESDKSTLDVSFVRSQNKSNRLRISAYDKSNNKKAVVALDFNEYATEDFDPLYDAYKINNPNDFPSLYFISQGDRLQVNTISEKNALKPVQLNISSTQTTTMEIWFEETPEINGCLLLYDNKTSSYYTIEDSAHFTILVDINDTIWGNRFEIEVLNAISEKNTINESCFETNDGQVELLFSNFTESWTIKNQKGDLISTGSVVNPLVENLKADYYTIDWNAANCGTFEDYFFITLPEEIKTKFEIPTSIIIGEEVSPNNINSGASSFKWLVNEVEKSTDPFPSFTFEQEGEFQIALEANEGDCKKRYSQS